MDLGVLFPGHEIGIDPGAVREWAQAVEGLGYSHVVASDHVLGADITNRPNWDLPNTVETLFHEPLVLLGYLAGCTERLGLATAIVILPQRQTALVAKQAAEVDVLSRGRLRLGVGLGRYEIEYEALGEDFHNRGRRVDEQVAVLRALWTQEVVTFQGKWHHISEAGINPLPVQRPIPIWFGGGSRAEAALRRIGRLADGWFPSSSSHGELLATLERLQGYARAAGRDPATIQIEGRMNVARGGPDDWRNARATWQQLGARYLSLNTEGAGFTSVRQHIDRLRQAKEALR